jgi:hypothetical protein
MTFVDIEQEITDFLSDNEDTLADTESVIDGLEGQIESETLTLLRTAETQLGEVLDGIGAIQDRLDTLLGYLTTTPTLLAEYKEAVEAFGIVLAVANGVDASEWDEGR